MKGNGAGRGAKPAGRPAAGQASGEGEPSQPDWVEPQLATLTADRFSDPGWIFERKLDGERCLAFSRGRGAGR